MQIPVQIAFRNMDKSDAAEAAVRAHVAKLEEFFDRITGCHVVIEAPHRHRRQGNTYAVDVYLTVPGRELVVNRDPGLDHAHEDLYVAIRDSFDEARRQLEDYVRELRGNTKQHEVPPHGRIASLFSDYGFIERPEGGEVYFHRNSLVGADFEDLAVGQPVRFVEELGEKGPQASTVHLVGRHGGYAT